MRLSPAPFLSLREAALALSGGGKREEGAGEGGAGGKRGGGRLLWRGRAAEPGCGARGSETRTKPAGPAVVGPCGGLFTPRRTVRRSWSRRPVDGSTTVRPRGGGAGPAAEDEEAPPRASGAAIGARGPLGPLSSAYGPESAGRRPEPARLGAQNSERAPGPRTRPSSEKRGGGAYVPAPMMNLLRN